MKSKHSFNEEFPELKFGMMPQKSNLFATENPDGSMMYDYYLIGPIEASTSEYVEMMQCLRSLSPEDLFVMHINCPGGSIHTGEQILSAMKDSPGYIVSSIEGEASSMATQLCLNSDEVLISDGSILMIHNLSAGAVGNFTSIEDTTAYLKSLNSHLAELYNSLLSAAELDLVRHGRDVTLFAEEVRKRLETFEYPRRKMREVESESFAGEGAPDLMGMIAEAVAEGIKQHEAEKAKKEAKARKVAERKPSPKLEKALDQAKEIREKFTELEKSVDE